MSSSPAPTLRRPSSDIAFSAAVKAVQGRRGSRSAYARMEQAGGWETVIDDDLRDFIESMSSAFLATASAAGQPYVQHRGGPPGFLKVIDERTIAFADFKGNRQYITQGNLDENPKAQLFLIDYTTRRRIKMWGTARVIDDDPGLVDALMPEGYRAKADQAIVFTVAAWDGNCPQHIPQRVEAGVVRDLIEQRDRRIAELEAKVRSYERPAHDSHDRPEATSDLPEIQAT
jgi:predicted pyridoxine 5'-phosphate oxidase superfamily flavin-nucleotide-binding protein